MDDIDLKMMTAFALQGLLAGHPHDAAPLQHDVAAGNAVQYAKATLAVLEADKTA